MVSVSAFGAEDCGFESPFKIDLLGIYSFLNVLFVSKTALHLWYFIDNKYTIIMIDLFKHLDYLVIIVKNYKNSRFCCFKRITRL
jgi:hypothetical protein